MKGAMLTVVSTYHWYDQVDLGLKGSEYREIKPYWIKRIEGKEYKHVKIRRGYSKHYMIFEVDYIRKTTTKNDLNLPECYEIKLGKRVVRGK